MELLTIMSENADFYNVRRVSFLSFLKNHSPALSYQKSNPLSWSPATRHRKSAGVGKQCFR